MTIAPDNKVALQIINQNPQESLLLNESVSRGKFKFEIETMGDKIEPLVCADFNYTHFLENIKPGQKSKFNRDYNARQKRPIISSKHCKGCKVCVNNCPMQAINIKSGPMGDYASIERDKCITCFKCVSACPYKIIKTKTPIKYYPIENMLKKHSKTNDNIDE